MSEEEEIVNELVRLGLTVYQSRVYSALAALGPSGVTELNRLSRVPRTKIYETLDEMVANGLVEFQPGRPIIYRAMRPSLLVKRMTEEYSVSAKKAETLLEKRYDQDKENRKEDLVWTVHGDLTIRRKLAEVVSSAKASVLILESYPPFFTTSIKSLLKTISKRKVKIRAVCVSTKDQLRDGGQTLDNDLIEYRTYSESLKRKNVSRNQGDETLMKALEMALSKTYGLAIIDDVESFVFMRNDKDSTRSVGLSAKIPGVPLLQRIMFERLFETRTSQNFRG